MLHLSPGRGRTVAPLHHTLTLGAESLGEFLPRHTGRLLTSLESNSFVGLSLALDVADRLGIAVEATTEVEERALRTPGSDPRCTGGGSGQPDDSTVQRA